MFYTLVVDLTLTLTLPSRTLNQGLGAQETLRTRREERSSRSAGQNEVRTPCTRWFYCLLSQSDSLDRYKSHTNRIKKTKRRLVSAYLRLPRYRHPPSFLWACSQPVPDPEASLPETRPSDFHGTPHLSMIFAAEIVVGQTCPNGIAGYSWEIFCCPRECGKCGGDCVVPEGLTEQGMVNRTRLVPNLACRLIIAV